MTCIIGLDLSLTSTGVVALRDGAATHCGTITSAQRGVLRLSELSTSLRSVLFDDGFQFIPTWAVIEGYAMGSRSGQAFNIGEWGGVARLLLHDLAIPFIEVPPSTLKKFTTGNGTAQKDEMRLAVFKRWGFEHKSNDVVDAYALARFGQAYLAVQNGSCEVDGKPLSKADLEIMRRFMEPPKKKQRKAVGE